MSMNDLVKIANQMVAPGKGILAADESTGTIQKRLDSIGVESTEENRRAYRELLFTTEGIEEYISGVILFDETLRQSAAGGTNFGALLTSRGILPGIKVDMGAKDLAFAPEEKVTEGLDGLRERLAEYASLGAAFTKWRAVITIGEGIPSAYCIEANAHGLARYAALSQEAGLVPIVEPEVLMDGSHPYDCRIDEAHNAEANSRKEKIIKNYFPYSVSKPSYIHVNNPGNAKRYSNLPKEVKDLFERAFGRA